jgi:hypothetical protein
MAAFSARMLVCSAMSLISSTIEPISCELAQSLDSLRGLLDLVADRVHALIVWRTTSAPLAAICTERCATSADSAEFFDTSSIDTAISLIAAEAEVICCAWCSAASARCIAVAWVSWAAAATCTAVSLIVAPGSAALDREVDRVRDRAGDVLGDRRADGEVAFRERAHFVQQAQNRLLVALVQLLGDREAARWSR